MDKRRVLLNAAVSAVQVLVVAGSYFVLYPYLLRTLGADVFGVWALVLATTAATNVANLGIAGSTVKFVAQYLARGDTAYVRVLIQTAALTVAAVLLIVLLLLYPLLQPLLTYLIGSDQPELVEAALLILPFTLASFWLTTVGNVFTASLEGFQRVDLRGYLAIGGILVYLGLAFYLVPDFGLLGLAWAQVAQAGLLVITAWMLLWRQMPSLPLLPAHWRWSACREMLSYSLNFQLITITQMLLAPTTTALLARLGGLEQVSYFEMAHRMVVQLRALLVNAHQAIVPTLAALYEKTPGAVLQMYGLSFRLLLYITLPGVPLLVVLTPFIAEVYVDGYNATFMLYASLLFAGWFFNVLGNPAYFANLGTGELRWNVISHLLTGGLNVLLGIGMGLWLGGTGVVIAFALALLAGSLSVALPYQYRYAISLGDLLDRQTLVLGVLCLIAMAAALAGYYTLRTTWSLWLLMAVLTSGYIAVIAVPFWQHPLRLQLLAWAATLIRRAAPPSEAPSS